MKLIARAICAAMFAVSSASAAFGAAYDKYAMPEEAKNVENGRIVQDLVPQAEIKTSINGSYAMVAMGGGLLGALIDAEIQKNQTEKAELLVQPIREALIGYDADAKAKGVTNTLAQNVAWLSPKEQLFSRDATPASQLGLLDSTSAAQVAFFSYNYGFNADFTSVRVGLNMNIANKAAPEGKKPATRLYPKNLVYSAAVTSVVSLPNATKDKEANAKLWAEDGAARTRAALDAAFADLPALGARVLNLQAADLPALRDRNNKMVTVGNDQGRVIAGAGDDVTLITTAGLVHLAPLSQAAPAVQVAAVAPVDAAAQTAGAMPIEAAAPAVSGAPVAPAAQVTSSPPVESAASQAAPAPQAAAAAPVASASQVAPALQAE